MIITVNPEDLAKNVPLDSDWYEATILKMIVKASSDNTSTNFIPTVKIKKDGRELDHYFNSKALGMTEAFAAVVLNKPVSELRKTGYSFEPDNIVNIPCKVHLVQEPYQGRINNKIDNWLPAGADTQPAF